MDWDLFLSRVLPLIGSCGILLLQLPKKFPFDLQRLEAFLQMNRHGVRLAVEFREASWFSAPVYRILEKHESALVSVSAPGVPCVLDVRTAPFAYYRLHGPRQWYKEAYSDEELRPFKEAARQALEAGDVYVYFDNTIGGHAYWNALGFKLAAAAVT